MNRIDRMYQDFADASLDHRCTSDPEIAQVIHEVQKHMELYILWQQGRLPAGVTL